MPLTTKEIHDLNRMNRAAQNAELGTLVASLSSGSLAWGNISGSIVNQTDLQAELDNKENLSNKTTGSSLGTSDSLYPTQKAVKGYVDAHTILTGSDVHGLGNLSLQSASAVNITGGTITPLTTHANLTGSNIHGLGTISTQSASFVNITGGSIIGISWPKKNIAIVNSPYTLLNTDYTLRCNAISASIVVYLIPAISSGQIYNIKNLYTSTCIVQVIADTTGTPDLIDGQPVQNIPSGANMQIQDGALNFWDIL